MKRYIRLYAYFIRFSLSKAFNFRVDFFFRIIMDIAFYIVQFLLFDILFQHTGLLGNWNEQEMKIFIASYIFIDALNMTIFSSNLWNLPIAINKGDLDYYLIKPASPFFFLTLREFSFNSFINLAITIVILIYQLVAYADHIQIFNLFWFLILLVNGQILHFLLHIIFILPVFWTQSPRGFTELFYQVMIAVEKPDAIYRGFIRFLFLFILPFALVVSFPLRVLIEKDIAGLIIHCFGYTIIFALIVRWMWLKCLRSYTSASS